MTRAVFSLMLLATCLGLSLAQEAVPKNLASNPSFEDRLGADGLPDGWNGFHSEPALGYRVEVAQSGHTGKRSLLAEGKGQFVVVRANKLRIDRMKRYRAAGWTKIEGDSQAAADVKFHYYDATGNYLDQTRVAFIQPRTPGWQKISVTDQLEQFPDADFIELAVALAGNGKAWFDDLELTAREEPRPAVINWVANGDMEELAADRPAGWSFFAAEGGQATGSADEVVRHAGKRSLHVTGKGEWVAAGSTQIRVDRKKSYSLKAFLRARGVEPHVSFAYFENGKYLGQTSSDDQQADSEWHEATVRSELANFPSATHLSVICGGANEIDAWLDDCVVIAEK